MGLFPDKDRTTSEPQRVLVKQTKSDLGQNGCFPNVASVGYEEVVRAVAGNVVEVFDTATPLGAPLTSLSRFNCFLVRFTTRVATGTVPTFTYITLTNDHTRTLEAGARTPRAMIADNDEALGRFVDTISHSPIWKSSAIFVVEDDSQDGADHVDAHRIPAFAISPYGREGAVVHTRYDFLSAIRSMQLIMGMRPLGLFDALGTPMYDAFQAEPANAAPFTYLPAKVPLLERNPANTPGAEAASRLPRCLDCSSQRDVDRLLWKSVHGWDAAPPPPGPNAEGIDPERLDHGDG